MTFMKIEDAVELMKMEYAEMPGLRLTFCQAQRLWNLSDDLCAQALGTLTACGFLARTSDGAYVRVTTHAGADQRVRSSASPVSVEAISSLIRAM